MLIFSSDLVNQNILYSLWRKVKCLSFHPKLLESDEFHLQRPISFHWPKESKPPGSGMDINMSEKHRVECSLPPVEIFWQWGSHKLPGFRGSWWGMRAMESFRQCSMKLIFSLKYSEYSFLYLYHDMIFALQRSFSWMHSTKANVLTVPVCCCILWRVSNLISVSLKQKILQKIFFMKSYFMGSSQCLNESWMLKTGSQSCCMHMWDLLQGLKGKQRTGSTCIAVNLGSRLRWQ